MKSIQIDGIIGRSEQGITQPFKCHASDGRVYYVKGRGAGYSSLVKELIVGRLAQTFGLPVAPFEVLEMPENFFRSVGTSEINDLGYGLVFGSRMLENVTEMTVSDISVANVDVMKDVLLFDWWVLNGDRQLSEYGGNPNLLWSANENKFTVIDFNLAFDQSVTSSSLRSGHIFRKFFEEIESDRNLKLDYGERFHKCLMEWDEIVNNVPQRWFFADEGQSVKIPFAPDSAKVVLDRHVNKVFWDK